MNSSTSMHAGTSASAQSWQPSAFPTAMSHWSALRDVARKVCQEGRLIAASFTREYDSLNLAACLATPCRAIRQAFLETDFAVTYTDRASRPVMPYPLVPLPKTYQDWEEYMLRHYACEINYLTHEWTSEFNQTVDWYYRTMEKAVEDKASDLSISKLGYIRMDIVNQRECMPLAPSFDSELDHSHEQYIHCQIGFERPSVQDEWDRGKTPHTPVYIFHSVPNNPAVTIYVGHVTVKPDESTESYSSGGSKLKGDRKDKNTHIRLSEWVYTSTREPGMEHNMARRRRSHEWIRRKIIDAVRPDADDCFHAAHTGPFLMVEDSILSLGKLSSRKRNALLHPNSYSKANDFDKDWSPEVKKAVYAAFRKLVEPFAIHDLAPQQLRVLMAHLLQLRGCSDPRAIFDILSVGGPPGTGKTATAAQCIILGSSRKFLRGTLALLAHHHAVPASGMTDEEMVQRMAATRTGFGATTNRAADEGCLALATHVATLKRRKAKNPDLDIDVTELPVALRFSEYDKAQEAAETFPHHSIVYAAKVRASEFERNVSIIQGNINAHHQRTAPYYAKRTELMRLEQKACEESEGDWDTWKLEAAKRAHEEAIYLHFCKLDCSDLDAQLSRAKAELEWLRDIYNHPEDYVRVGATPRKVIDGQYAANLFEASKEVLKRPEVVPFFTAGLVNCYHEELVKFCDGAQLFLDEASQATHSSIVHMMRDSSALVVMGDMHQLGAVIKADRSDVPDLFVSFLQRLANSTLWLTLGLRVHPVVSKFLRDNIYTSGYYYPTGQHLFRRSPLHRFQLFQPVVILNIAGLQAKPSGSTSRRNDFELQATGLYLEMYEQVAQRLRLPKRYVAAISPYAAHSKALESVLESARSSSFSARTATVLPKIQGATTDITIFNAVCSRDAFGQLPSMRFVDALQLGVAISRARFLLMITADVDAILSASDADPLFKKILSPASGFPIINVRRDSAGMREDIHRAATTVVEDYVEPQLATSRCDAPALAPDATGWDDKGEGQVSMDAVKAKLRSMRP